MEGNSIQVELAIKEAFEEMILSRTDFELLTSIQSPLAVPTLAPRQRELDGTVIHTIFKVKPVYVRPVGQILNSGFYHIHVMFLS